MANKKMVESDTYAGQNGDELKNEEVYEILLNACSHIIGLREKDRPKNQDDTSEPLPEIVKNLLDEIFKYTKDIRAANLLAASGIDVYIKGVRWKANSATVEKLEPTGKLFFRDNLEGLIEVQDKACVALRTEFYADHGWPEESEA